MKNFSKGRNFFFAFGLVLGGLLLIYQIILSIKSINDYSLPNTNIIHLFFALLFIITAIFFQILSWIILIYDRNLIEKSRIIELIKGYAFSFLPRYIPGSIWGYISRSEWLYQKFSVSYNKSNSTSILELASTITANLIILFLWINYAYLREKLYLTLIFIITFPILVWLLIRALFTIINKFKIKIFNFKFIELNSATLTQWLISNLLFSFHWFLYANCFIQVLIFLGNEPIKIIDSMFATCLSWLIGFAIFFVPAGIGFREASLSLILKDILIINIEIIPIAAIIFRFLSILGEITWILLKFVKTKKPKKIK
jgi:hypothetical protein